MKLITYRISKEEIINRYNAHPRPGDLRIVWSSAKNYDPHTEWLSPVEAADFLYSIEDSRPHIHSIAVWDGNYLTGVNGNPQG